MVMKTVIAALQELTQDRQDEAVAEAMKQKRYQDLSKKTDNLRSFIKEKLTTADFQRYVKLETETENIQAELDDLIRNEVYKAGFNDAYHLIMMKKVG